MRNIILIIIGFILTINLSAQTSRKVIQLTGDISDKYPIVMTLNIENGKVFGFYYYEKYKTKILLVGQMTGNKFTLNESPDYESDFKTGFIGEIIDSNFIGNWVDKTKEKTLKCDLIINSETHANLTTDILGIEGTYESIYNSEKYIGSVNLKNIAGDLFCFEISNGTESGCVGFLNGLVELKELKSGIFSTQSCEKLEFQLTSNELTVIEYNCDLHGMRCPFEGKYRKKE
ncbi:hypothetical protein [Plebeiibacterium sediminum]|uniref:Uncharacterized protein n=1 Tax=Plebeiibacterium sediminum TaxID=2992112 RepID=A0AAE3M974_9BACT|nr:hypothetical protein [Plebeiobacterium sediminum]MCW3788920.1 hypothetical protein [Plebeiobacterium sediminum]